jgi:NAD(P)-dependent dehydrogenase (short-subunit alcohol dehydrogenase family)
MTSTPKVVLVPGGTGELGRAVSLAFLEQGDRVIVTYRKQEELDDLETVAGVNVSRLESHECDITDEGPVDKLIEQIVAQHGRLDVMVNTVGAFTGGVTLWETTTKLFDLMLAVNVRVNFLLSRAAAKTMLKQSSGYIINIASGAAIRHEAGLSAYAASKAAAVAMVDCLAAELKGTGIRVNSILPSIFDTEANRKAMPKADFSKWPKPQDIARVITFLCSDDGKVIHGAAIPVFGNN